MTIEEFTKKCPVEIGDKFYRKSRGYYLEVVDIKDVDGTFYIRARYLNHANGPDFERTFSDMIFKDPDWVIEKRNAKGNDNEIKEPFDI